MRLLDFKCPHCGTTIMAEMMDVLAVGFTCKSCGSEVHPSGVFGEGKLDYKDEFLKAIGQETVDFYDFCEEQYLLAEENGFSRTDPMVQLPIMARSYVVIGLVEHFRSMNDE